MRRSMIPAIAILSAWLVGCAQPRDEEPAPPPPGAEPAEYRIDAGIRVNLPAIRLADVRVSCPNGEEPYSFTVEVCLEPREGTCTVYYCPDPAGGRPTLAIVEDRFGNRLPNPRCAYTQMQTEACTNKIELAARPLPGPRQWHEFLPHVFGEEMIDPDVSSGNAP